MNNETVHLDHGHQGAEHILEEIEELVDLEECACKGQKPPKAKNYRIRIDGEKFTVSVP